jgi:hypothetical protein
MSTISKDDYFKLEDEIKEAWFTDKEARILVWETSKWDTFDFCANFTWDIYPRAFTEYSDAQSEVAQEYKDLRYAKWLIADRVQNSRVQSCAAWNKNVTQDEIKAIYSKLGKTYKKHTW